MHMNVTQNQDRKINRYIKK